MQEQIKRAPAPSKGPGTPEDEEQIQPPKLDVKLMDRLTQAVVEPVFDETAYHECCTCGVAPHAAGGNYTVCCDCWGVGCYTRGVAYREGRRNSGDWAYAGGRGKQS